MSDRVRPFLLHLPHQVLDGFETADGWAVAIDDPEYGLTSAAPTPADLIRGYGGGHIEWPEPDPTHHQHEGGPHT
ncbi:hypothetical protein WB388_18070 [Streptomyces brasiliscabiei]|uniref:Uncharacterized protein n=1 Tax=Streptomyces brasiliscabiei TaxID=2736302 RepID=A0ABU8GH06_9ACTN